MTPVRTFPFLLLWAAAALAPILARVAAETATSEQPDPVDDIVAMAESNLDKLGGDTIIVFPFPYADGIKCVEGAMLAERVTAKLSEGGLARILERAMLDQIMAEQKLGAMGFVDPATSVRIGKLLNARGIVCGTVTDLGEWIEIHAKLLHVETGEVVATHAAKTRKTIKTFISPIWAEIDRIKAENQSFGVRMWVGRDEPPTEIPGCRIGDHVALRFVADRDCYVTIFDFTTSGTIHVLFPNSFMPDNHIRAGREYVIPGESSGFQIRATGPPGIERLKLFATTKDIPLFEENYAQESFRSVTEDSYSVPRDLQAVVDSLEDNLWAESHLEMRIERVLRGAQVEAE